MPALTRWSAMAAVLLMLGAAPAAADAARDLADCSQTDDSERRVRGCSSLIQSGGLDSAGLAEAHRNRGDAYGEMRDHRRALADYDKAIRLGTELAEEPGGDRYARRDLAAAYYKRGSYHVWRKGDFDRGIADLDMAIALDPSLVLAYRTRGWAYQKSGDYDRANADYESAIDLYVDDCPAGLKSFHPS